MVVRGRVLATRADGHIAVELTGQDACPGCRCGRLALVPDRRRTELLLDRQPLIRSGEEIFVTMPSSAVLRAALCLHGLPLAGLLVGAAAAAAAGFGDPGCFVGAVTGMSSALLLLRRIQRRWYSDAAKGLRVAPTS
jgi:positive regulator of sigma E activity